MKGGEAIDWLIDNQDNYQLIKTDDASKIRNTLKALQTWLGADKDSCDEDDAIAWEEIDFCIARLIPELANYFEE